MARLIAVVCLVSLLLAPVGLRAETRVAFVVGNAQYENTAALANPANDAALVSSALEAIGFEVTRHLDLGRSEFGPAFSEFLARTDGADVAVFYFAGHGMQLDGENYLLPTDVSLRSEFDVLSEGIALSDVTGALRRRAATALLFIDACRDNPLAEAFYAATQPQTRSAGVRGLAPLTRASDGSMVMFAAAPGEVAYDGTGANSPFSLALARHLPTPNTEVLTLTKRVIADVRTLTAGRQSPVVTNEIAREIYLRFEEDAPVEDAPRPVAPAPADGVAVASAVPVAPRPVPWMAVPARSATANLDDALTREQKRQVQAALGYLGTDPGGVDGQFGPRTRQAILAARQRLGLPPADHVSQQLLDRLPDARAIDALRSTEARVYDAADLVPGLEPRLARLIEGLGGRKMVFGYFEGRLYAAVQSFRTNWYTASREAARLGGHLATLTTPTEARFVSDLISGDPDYFAPPTYGDGLRGPFIGLVRVNGDWRWVTGEPVAYADWGPGQPDDTNGWEDVVVLRASRAGAAPAWDDAAGAANSFLVEIE